MSARGLGRNDPCPCGSGKKYKKCCNPRTFPDLTRPNAGIPYPLACPPAPRFFRRPPAPPPDDRPMTIDTVEVGVTRLMCAAIAPYGDGAALEGTLAPPTPEQVYAKYDEIRGGNPNNPTEVVVTYTFPEDFGIAETQIVFDADEHFRLPDGRVVSVLDLYRGMRVCTDDGIVATVVGHPERRYGIPQPPERCPDGRWLSRVMGRVRHTSYEVVEFRWAGQMVRVTPGHLVWSADRRGWVCAIELVPGERVVVSGNVPAPVEGPGRLQTGRHEVFGIEVEYFHNYFVGTGDDAMLVHNGPQYLTRLMDAEGRALPHGFKSVAEYEAFAAKLKAGLPEGAQPLFQGSSVTGRSYKTGKLFDEGRVSDFDIALVHDESFLRGLDMGLKAKDGTRIGPLSEAHLEALGLRRLQQELSAQAGRPVKFMLFDSVESALARPSIWVH